MWLVKKTHRIACSLGCWLLLVSSSVRATEPQLSPPELLIAPEVPHPNGAAEPTDVVLQIVIDADGSVRTVDVERGGEPYASAARVAARGWFFAPASRNGEAVASRIRHRVVFQRRGRPAPPPPDAPESPTKAPVTEILVHGSKPLAPSVSSFTRAEVRRLPGAFGDPFRAVEVLPGVTPIVSGLPFFYVRGAPPGNVGYFLDGVRVPYLFHVAAGPSVVHPGIVERVDLHAGGYSPRFGRFSGAIVSAETTAPNPEWRGEGGIRIVDAGGLVEGGFADGRGTVLVGGRYSYSGLLLSLLSPTVTVDYRDYQARISYDITDRDRVSLFAFGSYDYLSQITKANTSTGSAEVEDALFGTEFYRVDARYDARLDRGGTLRAAVTWGFDQTRLGGLRNGRNMLLGTRVEVDQPVSDAVTVSGGLNMQIDDQRVDMLRHVDVDDPAVRASNELFPPRADTGAAGWLAIKWKPTRALEVTPGMRVDTYVSGADKAVAIDPRLSAVVRIGDHVRLLHAVGAANQPPSFVVPLAGVAPANLRDGLQTAIQAASGIELVLPWGITTSVTGFAAAYLNMTDVIGSQEGFDSADVVSRSTGSAKGLEIQLRRSLSRRLGGFVAYTLSRTTRTVGAQRFVAAFDRTHVVHAALGYQLGGGWQAGARVSVYSGTPNGFRGDRAPAEAPRDPPFYRTDFRVEKRWNLVETVWLSAVVEMVNATLNAEVIDGERFDPVTVPSIGLEGGF